MSPFRGATAIVGIGQTPYYKRGTAPDPMLKLALRAIVAACADAGVDPRDVDGFVSYGDEKNTPAKLMVGLGTRELRFGAVNWGHGGAIPGAIGLAAAAIIAGQAEIVVVHKAMAQASNKRLQVAVNDGGTPAQFLVNGIDMIIQRCAMRSQRMIEHDGVPASAMEALARADYYHASRNPDAVAEAAIDHAAYMASRKIAEPYRLFDCSRENDGAAALVIVSAERAKDLKQKPAYILSSPNGASGRWGAREDNHEPYSSSGFITLAQRMWAESGYSAKDVDVVQVYENFSGMGVGAIIDHGFCTAEGAGELLTFDNLIAPNGRLPVNTSGGNLAEGFIHGIGLLPEAVRQIRGTSPNQVPGAKLSLMTGGPGDSFVSTALLGAAETL